MKYLGEEKTVKVTTKRIRNVEYIRCDRCKKKIYPSKYRNKDSEYVNVHTWHNDWGNDSIDSHEYFDLCKDCAKEFVAEYIDDLSGTEELELSYEHLSENETFDGFDSWEDGYKLAERDKND